MKDTILAQGTEVFIDNTLIEGVTRLTILGDGTYCLELIGDREELNDGKQHDLLIMLVNSTYKKYRVMMLDSVIVVEADSVIKTALMMKKIVGV